MVCGAQTRKIYKNKNSRHVPTARAHRKDGPGQGAGPEEMNQTARPGHQRKTGPQRWTRPRSRTKRDRPNCQTRPPKKNRTTKMDQAKEQDQKRRTKLLDQATEEQQDHTWYLLSLFVNSLVLRSSICNCFVLR